MKLNSLSDVEKNGEFFSSREKIKMSEIFLNQNIENEVGSVKKKAEFYENLIKQVSSKKIALGPVNETIDKYGRFYNLKAKKQNSDQGDNLSSNDENNDFCNDKASINREIIKNSSQNTSEEFFSPETMQFDDLNEEFCKESSLLIEYNNELEDKCFFTDSESRSIMIDSFTSLNNEFNSSNKSTVPSDDLSQVSFLSEIIQLDDSNQESYKERFSAIGNDSTNESEEKGFFTDSESEAIMIDSFTSSNNEFNSSNKSTVDSDDLSELSFLSEIIQLDDSNKKSCKDSSLLIEYNNESEEKSFFTDSESQEVTIESFTSSNNLEEMEFNSSNKSLVLSDDLSEVFFKSELRELDNPSQESSTESSLTIEHDSNHETKEKNFFSDLEITIDSIGSSGNLEEIHENNIILDFNNFNTSSNKRKMHFNDSINSVDYEKTISTTKAKECMEDLQGIFKDRSKVLAGREHTELCMKLIKICCFQTSIAEKIKFGNVSKSTVEGSLIMKNIRWKVKENFVLIDYFSLEKCNRGEDLRRLKKLYHIVLLVRSRGHCEFRDSMVYSIVSKSDARRLKLPHQPIEYLEMYKYVRFDNLRPEFKIIFDLHCMKATPKNYQTNEKTNNSNTLQKLLFHRHQVPNLSIPQTERSLFFTNMGSISLTASGLNPYGQSQHGDVELRLNSDCPFNGKVDFTSQLSLVPSKECRGYLNLYSEVTEDAQWSLFDCQLNTFGIVGTSTLHDHGDEDEGNIIAPMNRGFVLPFKSCVSGANVLPNSFDSRLNLFSIVVDLGMNLSNIPVNRLVTENSDSVTMFLAQARSAEDAIEWCNCINATADSLSTWANERLK